MACKHKPIREYDQTTGVNVRDGKGRYWRCIKCGKKSDDINKFK